MADMQDFAGVVALAIKAAMAPVLERVALMETKVTALASVDGALTELRERVVVAETKAAILEQRPVLEAKSLDLSPEIADVRRRVEAIEQRPDPDVPPVVDVTPLSDRLATLETKQASFDARWAADPLGGIVATTGRIVEDLAKDFGTLRERVAVVEVRQGVPGPAGTAGKDGRDGIDGIGFDDMAVEFDGERTLTIKAARGDRQKAWPFVLPYQYQRGVYIEGKTYGQGDLVTWAGSQWHANEETTARPGEGSKAWTLVVKRGRDGKDGKDAVTLPVVSLGGSRG